MKIIFLALFVCGLAFAEGYENYDGVRIHSSCLEAFGNDFPAKVQEGFKKGIACLKTLPLEKTPLENLKNLEENYQGKIMIACHEPVEGFSSPTVDAHASGYDGQEIPGIGLVHPFMSFNASRKDIFLSRPGFIGQVAFHESIHHLGLSHGKSIEYPYACEECCFNDDPATKEAACRICQSDYPQGVYSEKYGVDLEKLVNKSNFWISFDAGKILKRAILLHPDSVIFRELILDYDLYSNPLSILSARLWKDQFSSPVITLVSQREIPELILEFAQKALEARLAIFDEKNFEKASMIYEEMQVQALVELRVVDDKKARRLGKAVMDDIDTVWSELTEEKKTRIDKNYSEIKNAIK